MEIELSSRARIEEIRREAAKVRLISYARARIERPDSPPPGGGDKPRDSSPPWLLRTLHLAS
jgi:hypothetical protein